MNQTVSTSPASGPLLRVEGLRIQLGYPRITAVKGIDFSIFPGEILGLAGESGSGKSVTALALTRLVPGTAHPVYRGTVSLQGVQGNLLNAGERLLRKIRGGGIGYIFQEPSSSFNPLYTIGEHLEETLKVKGIPREKREAVVREALEGVGIPGDETHLKAYPANFSGGMLQRTALACSLLASPVLLVADEPTTALDTTTQKRVVEALLRINRERGMAILFITHDLGLLKQIAPRILVMCEGEIVEEGSTSTVLKKPQHPYTRELVAAVPKLRI